MLAADRQLTSRYQLASLLPQHGGVGAEVGVARGDFSFTILRSWPGTMTLIDPWFILETPGFSGHGENTNEGQEARYHEVLMEAEQFKGRAIVTRRTSKEAVKHFSDGSLDLVYIDAIHTREASAQDIALWYPKLKPGAILSGHDYLSGVFNGQTYGVKESVDEFAAAHGLTVNVIPEEWPSFWIRV